MFKPTRAMAVILAGSISSCAGPIAPMTTKAPSQLPALPDSRFSRQLQSYSLAQQGEIASLLGSSHITSWAYFRDPSQSIWYISHPTGTTYGLGLNNSRHSSWVAVANQGAVANVDFANKKVSLVPETATRTPNDSYVAISLVGGEAQETVSGNTANRWANLITGQALGLDWYFFQVASTGIWYIIQIAGSNSTILRLKLNASLDNYDWQKPVDGRGVGVDTANWQKEFFQENGTWKVNFKSSGDGGSGFGNYPLDTTSKSQQQGDDFGVKKFGRWHTGYDISTKEKNPKVLPVGEGKVVFNSTESSAYDSEYEKYWNAFVIVKHNGFYAYYGHLHSSLSVNDPVHVGTPIGTIRDSYNDPDILDRSNNHLHISISTGSDWIRKGWGYQTTEDEVRSKFVDPGKYIGL